MFLRHPGTMKNHGIVHGVERRQDGWLFSIGCWRRNRKEGCGTGAAPWRKPWTQRSLLKIVVVLFVADAAVGAANGGHVSRIIIVYGQPG